jgi:uncharacterized protein YjbI with pentapeptide repeats
MSSKSEERKPAIKVGGQSSINKSHQQKSQNRAWIGNVCVFGAVLTLIAVPFYFSIKPPPADWVGMAKNEEESQKIIEKINGKSTEIITIKKIEQSKTLWDWLSLLGVPITLLILGYLLQRMQQKRAENETNEEVLQVYIDRLSGLLVDKNLRATAVKFNPQDPEKSQTTPEEKELLDSAVDVIRARTLSILRRFENDTERKTSVIRFLIEADFISKLKLNLSDANLSSANLSGANLRNADLRHADLNNANLSSADLSGADLSSADLNKANLSDANLSSANLRNADLRYADLNNANLSSADLSVANLNAADLRHANLNDADLNKANLGWAFLRSAKLRGAKLIDAKLRSADLIDADLSGANLIDADLSGADLSGADLGRAILHWAKLNRSKLNRSKLNGAELIRADLSHAELIRADLSCAKFGSARLIDTCIIGADLIDADLSDIIFSSPHQIKSAKNWRSATYHGKPLNDPEVSKQLGLDTSHQ